MAAAQIKRGSSLCQICGYSNGNRAFKCKECGCSLPKKTKPMATSADPPNIFNNNVSSLLTSGVLPVGSQVYSVRVRSQGPDYRCFVSCVSGQWRCHFSECAMASEGRSRSGLDTPQKNCSTCQHVKEAQTTQCSEQGMHYQPCSSILSSCPFPPAVRAEFEAYLINGCTTLIQRVSSRSFVVVTSPTSESPLGLLHMRISSANSFQCTCNKYKRSPTSLASAMTAPKLSKRCMHFYLFLWAALSHDSLRKEFFLSENAAGTIMEMSASDGPTQGDKTVESMCVDAQEEHCQLPRSQTKKATKNFEFAPSRVTSTRIIQKAQFIPENPEDPTLKEVLHCIQLKDANAVLQKCSEQYSDAEVWASEYSPDDTLCKACNQLLSDKMRLLGSRGRTWLINKKGFQEVTVFIKSCRNKLCQARHSFHDWKSGLLNVSNKLLVSLELLLEMREHIRRGEPPGNTASAVILALLDLPSAPVLTPEETRYITNSMMVISRLKSSHREIGTLQFVGYVEYALSLKVVMGMQKNCTPLVGDMIQWPSDEEMDALSGEVDVDSWWSFLERKILGLPLRI